MATLAKAIVQRLESDWTLTGPPPGAGGFRVWGRWLVKDGPGSTPEAFSQTGRLLRNVVVLDGGEVGHPDGDAGRRVRRWDSFPTCHVFAEASDAGKAAVDAACRRIEALLCAGWEAVIDGGQRVGFRPDNRIALGEAEQFAGSIVVVLRFRATGARLVAA